MLDVYFKIFENTEQLMFLSLKSIDNIEKCNYFMLNVLSVCYCITNNAFEKDLENTLNLVIDYSRNTLDIIIIHKMMNSRLDNAYDVVL